MPQRRSLNGTVAYGEIGMGEATLRPGGITGHADLPFADVLSIHRTEARLGETGWNGKHIGLD